MHCEAQCSKPVNQWYSTNSTRDGSGTLGHMEYILRECIVSLSDSPIRTGVLVRSLCFEKVWKSTPIINGDDSVMSEPENLQQQVKKNIHIPFEQRLMKKNTARKIKVYG